MLIACTVTSGFGGFLGAASLLFPVTSCGSPGYHESSCVLGGAINIAIFVAYLFAWTVYLVMGAAWVGESSIPRWLPMAGTLAAVSYFLPMLMFANLDLSGNLEIIGVDLLLVSPAVALAIVLVRHHLVLNKKPSPKTCELLGRKVRLARY